MILITQEQRALLLANGAEMERAEDFDPLPVVKLFMLDGAGTWLLASDVLKWALSTSVKSKMSEVASA